MISRDDDEPVADDPSRDAEAVDETPDAADPKQQARTRQRKKHVEDQRAKFWRDTLASPIARLVLWEVFRDAGLFETKFACTPAGFPQSEATWFYLGQKMWLIGSIERC